MNNTKEDLFTTIPVQKAVLILAIPTIISQLITVVYNIADTYFIGHLNDPKQVAAATLAMPIFMFLTGIANLFGIGGASVISRNLGLKNYEYAKHTASFCIWSGVVMSILYGIFVYVARPFIFPILGATNVTWEYLRKYVLWTMGIGSMPTVMNALLAHLIRSEGYSSQAGFGLVFGGILNIVLDPIFIFVFKFQIVGAAMATMLANVIALFYFILFLYKIRKNTVIKANFKYFTLQHNIPSEVISVGLPSAIMTLMSTVSNTALNHLIASYSTEAVAGMGIAKKIDSLAYGIAQGMTQGTLPLIAYNYGAKNKKRMNASIKTLFIDSIIISIFGLLFLYFGAHPMISAFINNSKTIFYGTRYLQLISFACPTTALNFVIIVIFQATGKKKQPMFLSFLRKGTLDVPCMFLFNALLGLNFIPLATPVADLLALIIAIILFIPFYKTIKEY